MSFRNRLTSFFAVIVIVPILAVAVILYLLIAQNISGQTSASLAASQIAVIGTYQLDQGGTPTRVAFAKVSRDRVFIAALVSGDTGRARRRAGQLLRGDAIVRLAVFVQGRAVVDVGDPDAVAPDVQQLTTPAGRMLGTLEVSRVSAGSYARQASRLTGVAVIVTRGSRVLAASENTPEGHSGAVLAGALAGRAGELTVGRTLSLAGVSYRVSAFAPASFDDAPVRVAVLLHSDLGAAIGRSRLLVASVLGGFLALALAFALLVSRSLQQRLFGFLEAARRLGSGDLATRVPVRGRDEFAALGDEFNRMASQLESRLVELGEQRTRLERSLRRLGESFASNLDRDALLKIVLRAAVDGAGGQAGRAMAPAGAPGELHEAAAVGPAREYARALDLAELEAIRTGMAGAGSVGAANALACVLRGPNGANGANEVLGVIAVARQDRPFDPGERELLAYLARQAGVSIENVGLHEQVQRQALTDGLTGLSNHRRFVEVLAAEADRSRRFDQPVGLVLLDLDDFKAVNDTYGHQQGDEVLRSVAELMRSYSRDIDAPARYGGEELAVVLPQTDLDGAHQLAERLRAAISALEIPIVGGSGRMRVTASLGVASLPRSAADPERLIAAADAALYEAKAAGKNRTCRAG